MKITGIVKAGMVVGLLGVSCVRAQDTTDRVKMEHAQIGITEETKNAYQHTRDTGARWFPQAGFGLFVHWSIASVKELDLSWPMMAGTQLGWRRPMPDSATVARFVQNGDYFAGHRCRLDNSCVTPNEYWEQAREFNPRNYDPEKWVKAAKEAGMTYAVLTTRHHDGFAMWPSRFGNFSTRNYMGGRDLVKEFVDACRKYGLKVGLYYSGPDWYFNKEFQNFMYYALGKNYPDVPELDPDLHPRTVRKTEAEKQAHYEEVAKYIKGQVEELLTHYGKIDMIWFDGTPDIPKGNKAWGDCISMERIHELQPGIVVSPRFFGYGDYKTFEGDKSMPATRQDGWAELCTTIANSGWGYTRSPLKSTAFIMSEYTTCRSLNTNLLLNFGPDKDGNFSGEEDQRLKEIAEWMRANGKGDGAGGVKGADAMAGKGMAERSAAGVQAAAFDTILNRIYADLQEGVGWVSLDKTAGTELASQRGDGSWADIDYGNKALTVWLPAAHLKRLQDLASAYSGKGSRLYSDPQLYQAVVNGLWYWYGKDPKSANWWHNEIKVPQSIGQILIILRHGKTPIPSPLEDSLLQRMKRGDIGKQTGANKLDVAIHFLYRAVLTRNGGLMDTAVSQAFQPIRFTTGEGLQQDHSYLQHGPQLQLSSYGSVFLTGEYQVAGYVRGTPYAMADTLVQLLSSYYKDTYLKTIRGSYIDFSVEGRGISRPDILNKRGEKGRLTEAALVDPFNGVAWYAAMARTDNGRPAGYGLQPWHTHFWRADYSLHGRPSYSFNVRMVSTRTRRTEMGNKENIYGRYLPDGATDIQLNGGEYVDIMPVWEWDKIPGVTSRDHTEDLPMNIAWGEPGSTAFAGGVSDSLYGASGYKMNYDGVTANKSWFFFDKEIVALGAGIRSTTLENITTTVNQCWLNGPVKQSPGWVLHDGVGYFFPAGGELNVSTQVQKGNWYRINNSYSKKEVSGKVFKMWLSHGVQPADGKYAYIVVPGMSAEGDMRSYPVKDIVIVAHSDSVQAVRHRALKMVQAVFFKAGVLTDSSLSVAVDKPCIILLKNIDSARVLLSIADPTQSSDTITVTLRAPGIGQRTLQCHLPVGVYSGSTVTVSVDRRVTRDSVAERAFIKDNFSSAEKELESMLQETGGKGGLAGTKDSLFPRSTDSSGKMVATGMHDWTGGFFPGCLWYAYAFSGDAQLKKSAVAWTDKLAPMQYFTGHHDLGFLLYTSYGNEYWFGGDTSYKCILVQAAKSLSTRYNPKVGCIKSWNSFNSWHGGKPYGYPVIIDNMMNLELLFFASKVTGDPYYRDIAIRHAENTLKNQVREDYSCYHVVCYDSVTGAVLGRETAQGYADNSAWSRGQGWGIYGFTVAYRETKDPRFLATARKMADFYLNHKNLPEDKVPYWDFNVNEQGYTPGLYSRAKQGSTPQLRDASAAAVVASALFELSTYLGKEGEGYYNGAVKIVHSLAGPAYRAEAGTNAHFLLKHSVGSIPHGFELDVPLIYADYYFLEALYRYDALLQGKPLPWLD